MGICALEKLQHLKIGVQESSPIVAVALPLCAKFGDDAWFWLSLDEYPFGVILSSLFEMLHDMLLVGVAFLRCGFDSLSLPRI